MSRNNKSHVGEPTPLPKTRSGSVEPTNRGGRPKGSPNVKTIVQRLAQERHTIREGEHRRSFTTVELLIRALMTKAMSGDIQAEKYLEHLRDRFAPAPVKGDYLVLPEPCRTPEEWIERYGNRAEGNSLSGSVNNVIE